ncbi:MAG: cryptochrome/photolyase family protein [Chitinophagaceae bacterium]
MNKPEVNIFWFRRDLRLHDNVGLLSALQSERPVLPIFIFDTNILDKLDKPEDLRVQFIHQTLIEIDFQLKHIGSGLTVMYGTPQQVFLDLLLNYNIGKVYTNHDYEPYAIKRDQSIEELLSQHGVGFLTSKDQVIFEKKEVTKDDGLPYTVFTPYSKRWKAKLAENPIQHFPSETHFDYFLKYNSSEIISLEAMGFLKKSWSFPLRKVADDIIKNYAAQRDFPAIEGTSRLGVHLRFGTISVRQQVINATGKSETFLNELIWREFYHQILFNFPHVGEGKSFKRQYDQIQWRDNEVDFEKWCKGVTGYPIVDAGMRELAATGYMHNRVRMITASFLTKHLFLDWRWGEAWFASKLLDFDLAANNGGWQWAAGSGCDAAPYFRIFNPALQTDKFDKKAEYIRKWIPEFDSLQYPAPMVQHEFARKRCLENYAKWLGKE